MRLGLGSRGRHLQWLRSTASAAYRPRRLWLGGDAAATTTAATAVAATRAAASTADVSRRV